MHRSRDGALIYAAGFLRSTTVGLVGVVLAIYLFQMALKIIYDLVLYRAFRDIRPPEESRPMVAAQ